MGMLRHPYLVLALLCLFVNAFFNVKAKPIVSFDALAVLLCAVIAGAMIYVMVLHPERHLGLRDAVGGAAVLALLALLLLVPNTAVFVLAAGLSVTVGMGLYWGLLHRLTPQKIVLLLFAAGFVIRVAYILYTPMYVRQHDVLNFGMGNGHAGYIEWFYDNMRIPNFDPRKVWQFYHPPLHHWTTAIWMRLNVAMGMTLERAYESTQILTLYYASACTLLCYRLMRELGVGRKAICLPMALLCFHPTLVILSGSVNNDILSITLQLAAVLFAVRWYKKPTVLRILPIAAALGCAMMAKTSGGLAAVAIALLFLFKLIEQRRRFLPMIGQYAAFGAVCVPLGLWWQVSNFIRFGMPINYVPRLSNGVNQYIGGYSVWERLFDPSLEQFKSVFVAWGRDSLSTYHEHNVFIGLLKTSMFGEFTMFLDRPVINIPATILFYVNIAIVALAIFAMIRTLCVRSLLPGKLKAFLGVWYLTVMVSFVVFCFQFPHTCTQDFRYAVPTLFVGLVFLGVMLEDWSRQKRRCLKPVSVALSVLTGMFCAGSTAVFVILGL